MEAKKPLLPKGFFRFRDEGLVWFTALGLVVGLAMVAWLLGVVVVNGVTVFWPKRVESVTFADGTAFYGEKVLTRVKRLSESGREEQEVQYFLANKEKNGQPYKFASVAEIRTAPPERNLLKLERMEYGPLLALPVRLRDEQGKEFVFAADQGAARAALARSLRVVDGRREKIRRLEQSDIGAINASLEALRLEQKQLDQAKDDASKEEKSRRLAEKTESLQKKYETLSAEASGLRAEQDRAKLTVAYADGTTADISVGQGVHAVYPNDIGPVTRLGVFLRAAWVYVSEDPRESNTDGGVFPAIFGTFVMTLMMSVAVMPFGVMAAIYLREYAKQGLFVRSVRIAVNNLAGVPSIVFGVFGLGFFVYVLGNGIDQVFFASKLPTPTFGTGGILWASLTLALMTVPVVIVATEESLAAVSRGVREGALALGSTKWQTIRSVVMPAAAPGMLTGLILAMARGAGEVAPLMLVGVVKLAPALAVDGSFPFVHLDRKFMHLGFHIYDLGFQSPDSDSAKPMVFATTLLLIALVVCLNLFAILIRNRLRKKYATGAF